MCTASHHSYLLAPTCNLYFHSFIHEMLVVVGGAPVDTSIRRLYSAEMQSSNPSRSEVTYATSNTLTVHIRIRIVGISQVVYTRSIIVSPEETLQRLGSIDVLCLAPNADILVNTKHHWTSECRPVLCS